jgi:hypothetical protein
MGADKLMDPPGKDTLAQNYTLHQARASVGMQYKQLVRVFSHQ